MPGILDEKHGITMWLWLNMSLDRAPLTF